MKKSRRLIDMTENEVQDRVYWRMHMQETIGTFMLGVICIMLVVFLKKSEERNQALMLELIRRH
jgi:uncharacterized membrane protein